MLISFKFNLSKTVFSLVGSLLGGRTKRSAGRGPEWNIAPFEKRLFLSRKRFGATNENLYFDTRALRVIYPFLLYFFWL